MTTPADALASLRIVGPARAIDVAGALAEPPRLALDIDSASTLEVVVADHTRELLRHPATRQRSWAQALGIRFELVAVSKGGDFVTYTFEDAIVAALRKRRKKLVVKPGITTRAAFAVRLAREAKVPHQVDPTHKGKVHTVLERSTDGEKTSSWDVLGEQVAAPIRWRRFSDGSRLVVGGDEWLQTGWRKPLQLREHQGGVQDIDFDLDVAKRASAATMTVDTEALQLRPGQPVRLTQLGPADGGWLVAQVSHDLGSPRASVTLTRGRHALDEPKKKGKGRNKRPVRDRDTGSLDFVPTAPGLVGGGTAATTAREKLVRHALAQVGKPYSWGEDGPNAYDCSGLIEDATRAAGDTLPRPSSSQWATCQRAGRSIAVDAALKIRGALLFRAGDEDTPDHVAISLGNGSTVEARGQAYGVDVHGDAADQDWTGGALWP